MYFYIETERLFIRPINLNDTEFMLELLNSEGWLKYIGNSKISSLVAAQDYIQRIHDNPSYFYSVFELKSEGDSELKPMGIITYLKRDKLEYPDIGFAIKPEFENMGFTFEACKSYLTKILELPNYNQDIINVIGITIPDNIRSVKLLEKLGLKFAFNYEDKDEVLACYSLESIENKKHHS